MRITRFAFLSIFLVILVPFGVAAELPDLTISNVKAYTQGNRILADVTMQNLGNESVTDVVSIELIVEGNELETVQTPSQTLVFENTEDRQRIDFLGETHTIEYIGRDENYTAYFRWNGDTVQLAVGEFDTHRGAVLEAAFVGNTSASAVLRPRIRPEHTLTYHGLELGLNLSTVRDFTLTVDAGNQIDELNEENNVHRGTFGSEPEETPTPLKTWIMTLLFPLIAAFASVL